MNILTSQYEMIKRTRESIRNLHVHVSDCYRVCLGVRGLGRSIPKLKPESIRDVKEMRALFAKTDLLVDDFLHKFKDNWDADIQAGWMSETAELSKLWLFTHCTTHEFHHRGQITKIVRLLGTIPPKMNLSKIK